MLNTCARAPPNLSMERVYFSSFSLLSYHGVTEVLLRARMLRTILFPTGELSLLCLMIHNYYSNYKLDVPDRVRGNFYVKAHILCVYFRLDQQNETRG